MLERLFPSNCSLSLVLHGEGESSYTTAIGRGDDRSNVSDIVWFSNGLRAGEAHL